MQVTVEDISPVEKNVRVELGWEEVKAKVDEAYRDLGKQVRLPGFRKGNVPRSMLEKMFGKKIEKHLGQALVDETFPEAARSKGLHPVGEPVAEFEAVAAGQPFRYSARVEVAPEVEPKDYDGVTLARRAARVPEEAVDRELERLRDENAELLRIEGRGTAAGDVLLIDVKGRIGSSPISAERVLLDLSAEPREPLPGLARALTGIPAVPGDREVELTFPEDHPREDLRGGTTKLTVTVRDVREKRLPELDDEFAKDTGEADTLAELREVVRRRLAEHDRREIERELRVALIDEVARRNPFELTPALVERQLDQVMARMRAQLSARGADPDEIGGAERELREGLRDTAEAQVRRALLLDAIARKENVEVLDADLEKRLAEVARARGSNLQRVKADLAKDGRLEGLRAALREEKVLDLLLSRATISDEANA